MDWEWYDVTLVVTNPYGSDSMTKVDYIEVIPESVREIGLTDKNVHLYPNPGEGIFTLSLPAHSNASIELMDMHGLLLFKQQLQGTESIDPGVLEQGIYIVRIRDTKTGQAVIKRLIVR